NTALVHSSASALSTAGVLTGHGPSSKVSTTSLSARKSSCLKCSKPKPGPPVVSISTTRLRPSASGLAHTALAGCGATTGFSGVVPVASMARGALVLAGPVGGSCGAGPAATGGGANSWRGWDVQNQTPAMATSA